MKNVIETVIGTRVRMSCGETSVPTYYGAFRRGDKAALRRAGCNAKSLAKASGIRTNGALITWHGNFYSESPAMNTSTLNWLRNHEPQIFVSNPHAPDCRSKVKNETFTNTTASSILTMMASDHATANLDVMEIGESISVTGVRNLINGGVRTSDYTVTRVANDRGSRRYTCQRVSSEGCGND